MWDLYMEFLRQWFSAALWPAAYTATTRASWERNRRVRCNDSRMFELCGRQGRPIGKPSLKGPRETSEAEMD